MRQGLHMESEPSTSSKHRMWLASDVLLQIMRVQDQQEGHTLQAHEACAFEGAWNVRGYVNSYNPVESGPNLGQDLDKFKIADNNQSVPGYPMYKRHMCTFCRKVYPLKNLLKRHMQFGCKMNPRSAQFACTFCPYKSMYKANMERHVRNVHDTGGLKFRCDLCNFRSNYSFCVRRHMKTFHRAPNNEQKQ